jgi:hypothetical protein
MKKRKRPSDTKYNDGMLIESLPQGFWLKAILLIVGAVSVNLPAFSVEINMHIMVTVYPCWIVPFIFFQIFEPLHRSWYQGRKERSSKANQSIENIFIGVW